MNLRLKFSRKGPVKYLGHLDMMRYFQKALMRAEIDMKYSEGFNPHQILSFAYPLGVSMETEGDYMDIEVNSMDSLEKIVDDLNAVINEGVKIVSASIVPEDELNAMASVAAASYEIVIDSAITEKIIDDFFSQSEILIEKENKKAAKKAGKRNKDQDANFITTKDIKAGIYNIKLAGDSCLELFLQSGSSLNVKPGDVVSALSNFTKETISIISVKRLDIYRQNADGKLVPLGEF